MAGANGVPRHRCYFRHRLRELFQLRRILKRCIEHAGWHTFISRYFHALSRGDTGGSDAGCVAPVLLASGKNRSTRLAGRCLYPGAASVALWTVGGAELGWELSLAVNAVGFVACGLMWDAARAFHGRPANWIGVIAGPAIWIGAVVLLDPLDPEIRMLLGAGLVALYAALTAGELWRERRKSLRARWPAIAVPLMHGAVLMLPIVIRHVRSGNATSMSQICCGIRG